MKIDEAVKIVNKAGFKVVREGARPIKITRIDKHYSGSWGVPNYNYTTVEGPIEAVAAYFKVPGAQTVGQIVSQFNKAHPIRKYPEDYRYQKDSEVFLERTPKEGINDEVAKEEDVNGVRVTKYKYRSTF
jgi:hypothetical protein